jgi:integrase
LADGLPALQERRVTKLPYLRVKRAKGRNYYYLDLGLRPDGTRELTPLPHIKDRRFGDCYARAKATRTNRRNKQGILTLEGLIKQYERSPEFRALSAASQVSYTRYLGRANGLMRTRSGDSVPARSVERRDIIAMRDQLADTPGAASQAVRALGALFVWAIDNEKLKENPAAKVKKFAAKPHEKWPEALLEEGISDPQVGMVVALMFFTGQRINEAVKMSWADIGGGFMRVFVQKTKQRMEVAILPELADMLGRQPKLAPTILTNANGQPWTQSGLRQKIQDWAKARGFKVVPHGLRKNAVDALLEAGCTAAEVSGITGHSIGMVEHYSKGVNWKRLGSAAVVKFDAARKARKP